jgi:hypothetical protein
MVFVASDLAAFVRALDGCYRGAGETAPLLSDDALCVRLFEMGRRVGEHVVTLREYVAPLPPLEIIPALFSSAAATDSSGALSLYLAAMVVGPRLLVSIRDVRSGVDPTVAALLDACATTVVQEIRLVGDVVSARAPIDDPAWIEQARDLVESVEMAGFGDSFALAQ